MRILIFFITALFLSGIYLPSTANEGCTYCYQIASVEITFRNKKVQRGFISWSPDHDTNLNEKVFLKEAKKMQRIRFYRELSKRNLGTEENEVNVYYALARNVMLLRRFDIKKLKILDSNFGATRSNIQIVKKWR